MSHHIRILNAPNLSSHNEANTPVVVDRPETQSETRVPRLYKVLLLNDDYTPMEFVVQILKKFFSQDEQKAVDIMLQVHEQGYGVAGVYQYDIAETKVHQVHSYAKAHEHPLRCRMEAE